MFIRHFNPHKLIYRVGQVAKVALVALVAKVALVEKVALIAKVALLASVLVLTGRAYGQQIQFEGYVRTESIYDTRQVLQVREGQFHLFPLEKSKENSNSNLLLAAFRSRVAVSSITSEGVPGVLAARIEGDFFGATNDNVNMLRLRHAYIVWTYQSHQVLFGQTWSPLFTSSVIPGTVGFATGAPFQPFARFPQLRYTKSIRKVSIEAAVSTQLDAYQEIGGRKMHHQSGLPAGHIHVSAKGQSGLLVGVGGTVKSIRPELGGDSFRARAATAYAKVELGKTTLKVKSMIGEDLADHLMPGGFIRNSQGMLEPTRLASAWMDVSHPTTLGTLGVFAGYLINLGVPSSGNQAAAIANTRAANLKDLWRIAPRLVYTRKPLTVSMELEATSAQYGQGFDTHFVPVVVEVHSRVLNVRWLLAAYYNF